MKKTITKQDGTKEEVEGSAEEIAEYERKTRGEVKEQVKKPELLKDVIDHKLAPVVSPIIPSFAPMPIPQHDPGCDIITAQRGWWSVIPPRCTCGLFAYPIPGGTVRYYFTTDRIEVGDVIPDPYTITCSSTAPRA